MAITTEDTSFTHDILGRYVCNTFPPTADMRRLHRHVGFVP
jgi:hypothetical protein